MAAWVREEENTSKKRQRNREAEEADKVKVASGVTVASLRRFKADFIGLTPGPPKRRRLCRYRSLKLQKYGVVDAMHLGANAR